MSTTPLPSFATGGGGGGGGRRNKNEKQASYARQATILRKNLMEWDRMLRTPRGEDWPTMLGRLNAAYNQSVNLDSNIDDVMEHFVYQPIRATANPQDIPFFLSTRLESQTEDVKNTTTPEKKKMDDDGDKNIFDTGVDPVRHLTAYERDAARLVEEYEENMIRY